MPPIFDGDSALQRRACRAASAPAQPARRARRRSGGWVDVRHDGSLSSPSMAWTSWCSVSPSPVQLAGHDAVVEHEHPGAQGQQVADVGRRDDDAEALAHLLGDEVVDGVAGADVDAGGRLAQHEHLRVPGERAPEEHLLLVAAAQRLDRARRRRPPSRPACRSSRWRTRRSLAAVEPEAASRTRSSTDSDRFSSTVIGADDALAAPVGRQERDARRPSSRRCRSTPRRRRGGRGPPWRARAGR